MLKDINRTHLTAAAAMTAAVLFLFVLQFLPWAAGATEIAGNEFTGGSYTWYMTVDAPGAVRDTGWYSEEFDGESGISMVRAGVPLFVVALIVGTASATAAGVGYGLAAAIGGGVSTAAMALGTGLFASGAKDLMDGFTDFAWSAGFLIAIIVCVLLAVGAVLSYMADRMPDDGNPVTPAKPSTEDE